MRQGRGAKRPFLIAFLGSVGSGKSYVARVLAKKIGAAHIRTDDIRVMLRRQGKSYSRASRLAKSLQERTLLCGQSVIADFDAVLAKRRMELKKLAEKYGAKMVVIQVKTPKKLVLARLRRHRYTRDDLFQNAEETIRVYFNRRKLHQKRAVHPDFVINNARPLQSQIHQIVQQLQGL